LKQDKRQNKIILERAREFNQWQQIGRKITKQNSDNLESSIQYKIDYLQVIRSTQNKTYQLWCFIFIQRTYFAILHLRNLNFDFFQFFLSKHLLFMFCITNIFLRFSFCCLYHLFSYLRRDVFPRKHSHFAHSPHNHLIN